jgi:hypothetical protein
MPIDCKHTADLTAATVAATAATDDAAATAATAATVAAAATDAADDSSDSEVLIHPESDATDDESGSEVEAGPKDESVVHDSSEPNSSDTSLQQLLCTGKLAASSSDDDCIIQDSSKLARRCKEVLGAAFSDDVLEELRYNKLNIAWKFLKDVRLGKLISNAFGGLAKGAEFWMHEKWQHDTMGLIEQFRFEVVTDDSMIPQQAVYLCNSYQNLPSMVCKSPEGKILLATLAPISRTRSVCKGCGSNEKLSPVTPENVSTFTNEFASLLVHHKVACFFHANTPEHVQRAWVSVGRVPQTSYLKEVLEPLCGAIAAVNMNRILSEEPIDLTSSDDDEEPQSSVPANRAEHPELEKKVNLLAENLFKVTHAAFDAKEGFAKLVKTVQKLNEKVIALEEQVQKFEQALAEKSQVPREKRTIERDQPRPKRQRKPNPKFQD